MDLGRAVDIPWFWDGQWTHFGPHGQWTYLGPHGQWTHFGTHGQGTYLGPHGQWTYLGPLAGDGQGTGKGRAVDVPLTTR
jgi:hypothetical protein